MTGLVQNKKYWGVLLSLFLWAVALPALSQVVLPVFDIVRVGPDGFAVMAGRGPSDAEVRIFDGSELLSKARSNETGEWAIITENPLPVGDRKLRLEAKLSNGRLLVSDEILVVSVPKRGVATAAGGGATMALLLSKKPGGVSRLLQKPEPEKGLSESELGLNQLSYSKKSPLQLQGSGRPGSLVRVYLNNRHQGDATAGETGAWNFKSPNLIAAGRQTLRLDQIGSNGKVDARIEVAFGEAITTATVKTGQAKEKTRKKRSKTIVAERQNNAATTNSKAAVEGQDFVVQRGQNLWRIAQKVYGEGFKYTVIFRANKGNIRNPDRIYPGQVLKLPKN